jgi:exosortase
MAAHDSNDSQVPSSLGEAWQRIAARARENPKAAGIAASTLALFLWLMCGELLFASGSQSVWRWASESWNSENDLDIVGYLILPGAFAIAWLQREKYAAAEKGQSFAGLAWFIGGVLIYLLSARTLQGRLGIVAVPVMLYGAVGWLWGKSVMRLATFPCAFMLFMVPVGFVLQRTEPLQRLVAGTVHAVCKLLMLGVNRDGVKLIAADNSFNFEVAGGCSGIRSLMAMAMLCSVYGYFTQRTTKRRLLMAASALPFAVVGNLVRVFSIVLVSKFISPTWGPGAWHNISGFIVTIPIAVFLMLRFGDFLEGGFAEFAGWKEKLLARDTTKPSAPAALDSIEPSPAPESDAKPEAPKRGGISYDY